MDETSAAAALANGHVNTQQADRVWRLYRTMNRYRGLALSVVRPVVLALLAVLLILVVLPAALGAQAAAIR